MYITDISFIHESDRLIPGPAWAYMSLILHKVRTLQGN